MYCLYCGKRLPLIRRLSGAGEYCSEGHRDRHVDEQSRAAMARLLESRPEKRHESGGISGTKGGVAVLERVAEPPAAAAVRIAPAVARLSSGEPRGMRETALIQTRIVILPGAAGKVSGPPFDQPPDTDPAFCDKRAEIRIAARQIRTVRAPYLRPFAPQPRCAALPALNLPLADAPEAFEPPELCGDLLAVAVSGPFSETIPLWRNRAHHPYYSQDPVLATRGAVSLAGAGFTADASSEMVALDGILRGTVGYIPAAGGFTDAISAGLTPPVALGMPWVPAVRMAPPDLDTLASLEAILNPLADNNIFFAEAALATAIPAPLTLEPAWSRVAEVSLEPLPALDDPAPLEFEIAPRKGELSILFGDLEAATPFALVKPLQLACRWSPTGEREPERGPDQMLALECESANPLLTRHFPEGPAAAGAFAARPKRTAAGMNRQWRPELDNELKPMLQPESWSSLLHPRGVEAEVAFAARPVWSAHDVGYELAPAEPPQVPVAMPKERPCRDRLASLATAAAEGVVAAAPRACLLPRSSGIALRPAIAEDTANQPVEIAMRPPAAHRAAISRTAFAPAATLPALDSDRWNRRPGKLLGDKVEFPPLAIREAALSFGIILPESPIVRPMPPSAKLVTDYPAPVPIGKRKLTSTTDLRMAFADRARERFGSLGALRFWRLAPADLKWITLALPIIFVLLFQTALKKPRPAPLTPPAAEVLETSVGSEMVEVSYPKGKRGIATPKESARQKAETPASGAPAHGLQTDGVTAAIASKWEAFSTDFNARVSGRAAVELEDDFRSGLGAWAGGRGWAQSWGYDRSGFVRPGSLAIYRPTIKMSDYVVEIAGHIENRALGWAIRARDTRNYYAYKLIVSQAGPVPSYAVERWAVVGGREGGHKRTDLFLPPQTDSIVNLKTEVRGGVFTTSIRGQVADVWEDWRLTSGGVGVFSQKGEGARIHKIGVTYQNDAFGKLCALLASADGDTKSGGSKE